jgi:16S rRNA (cytosine1402-N4)-methyltransferase
LLAAGAGQIVALDQDPQALAAARARVEDWLRSQHRPLASVTFHHLNFAEFHLDQQGLKDATGLPLLFDGILADLGVSSPQLDQPQRGFSFRQEGPLDMRMNPQADETAADWINQAEESTLVDLFSRLGEERYARRIARRIVQHRPFATTIQLADTITQAVPPAARHGRIHPATRVFQALRLAVNHELEALESLLDRAPDWLSVGGRLAVISFHSLEDRQVKWRFRRDPRLQVITPKPIQPQPEELARNPRARSAKLRIATRRSPPEEILSTSWDREDGEEEI